MGLDGDPVRPNQFTDVKGRYIKSVYNDPNRKTARERYGLNQEFMTSDFKAEVEKEKFQLQKDRETASDKFGQITDKTTSDNKAVTKTRDKITLLSVVDRNTGDYFRTARHPEILIRPVYRQLYYSHVPVPDMPSAILLKKCGRIAGPPKRAANTLGIYKMR